MKAKIHISSEKPLSLPINYNYILQAVVLRWIGDSTYQKFVHDTGYTYNKRIYKMYTFSRLQGIYTLDKLKKIITFPHGASLTISSADNMFLQYLLNNIISNDKFTILDNDVYIDKMEYTNEKLSPPCKIHTLSPIVTYSTFQNENTKKTYYYSPYEKEFSDMLGKNLIKKYIAIYGKEPEDTNFNISIINKNNLKESVIIYKATVIKGWSGSFLLDGSKELINIAYDAGLGSKNSQGFGCIEIM